MSGGSELVSVTRVGRETHYKLRLQPLDEAAHWIQMVSAEWDERLGDLLARAAGLPLAVSLLSVGIDS